VSNRTDRLVTRLAGRAASDPAYLGWLLDRYRVLERLSTSALATLIGIGEESLPSLQLCLRPRAECFGADVLAIAARFGADAAALAAIVRQVEGVDAMAAGGGGSAKQGWLLAAKSRDIGTAGEPGSKVGKRSKPAPTNPMPEDQDTDGDSPHDEEAT
jgi:hypothetical protein